MDTSIPISIMPPWVMIGIVALSTLAFESQGSESASFEIDTQSIPGNGGGSLTFTIDTQAASGSSELSATFVIDTLAPTGTGSDGRSTAFVIDTLGISGGVSGGISTTFVIDTLSVTGGNGRSPAFVIDTLAPEALFLAAYSPHFKIDTRAESEKLAHKFQLWAVDNAPLGRRGMTDIADLFGVPNLLAFALGWEADHPSTWYRSRITDLVESGVAPGVWLRTHRRNDLPELIWTWRESDDLTGFPTAPNVLDNLRSPSALGGTLSGSIEQWDIRVPLPHNDEWNFYKLELSYEDNP